MQHARRVIWQLDAQHGQQAQHGPAAGQNVGRASHQVVRQAGKGCKVEQAGRCSSHCAGWPLQQPGPPASPLVVAWGGELRAQCAAQQQRLLLAAATRLLQHPPLQLLQQRAELAGLLLSLVLRR